MEIKTSKGTFIVVPVGELFDVGNELIGLVSEILKDEEKAELIMTPVADTSKQGYYFQDERNDRRPFKFMKATNSFQSLCNKYELKESDLLIRKL